MGCPHLDNKNKIGYNEEKQVTNNVDRIEQIVDDLRHGHISCWEAIDLMMYEGMSEQEANNYLEHCDMRG